MTNLSTPGDYTNGTTADGDELTADFSAIKTFLNTTGVAVYQAGTVVAAALANSAVETAKINNGAVTNAKLGADCVDGTKIADAAVDTEHLVDEAVTTAKVADGAITSDKLAANIEAGGFVADNSVAPRQVSKVAAVEITSDINVNNPGTSTFGGTTATSGEVVLLAGQVSTAHQNGPWVFNGSGSAMTRPTWYDSSLDAFEGFQVHCLRGDFAGSRWRLATSGTITVGSTSTSWQCLDYVGAGTTGNRPSAARIAAGGIYVNSSTSTTERSDGSSTWTAVSISSSNIADGTIVNADVSNSAAIAYSKLNLSNSIVAGDLTSGSVTEAKIGSGAVTSAKIDSTVAKSVDVQTFTSSGTWTKPSNAKSVHIICIGGGGGGGAGHQNGGGGGGGAGGSCSERTMAASSLGSTVTVTVGSGGSSGDFIDGGGGGLSSFGSHVKASGGGGGSKSTDSAGGAGGVGGSTYATHGVGGSGGSGGLFSSAGNPGNNGSDLAPGGGGGGGGWNGTTKVGGAGGGATVYGVTPSSGVSGAGGSGGSSDYGESYGNLGYDYGAGGGGGGGLNSVGYATSAGADGRSGVVVVTTYF